MSSLPPFMTTATSNSVPLSKTFVPISLRRSNIIRMQGGWGGLLWKRQAPTSFGGKVCGSWIQRPEFKTRQHYNILTHKMGRKKRPIEEDSTQHAKETLVALGKKLDMKLVMDICKQMTMETASIEMSKKPPEGQSLSSENMDGQEHVDRHHEEKQVKRHHPDRSADRSPDLPFSGNNSDKLEDDQPQGSYVIGGSNFGWNFVLFPGSKAVYYGVTKESFLMKM
ncbi:hypothetical protein IFM89_037715 [Coptis chinensis]|uniref:Uncharacterized protein n=1 Tax=Coptis chinensis TaxID=261450 RepID=A0A835IJK8_9MAGN|nr:hypothetical protein IFM89_037715 [Coptis chinensis]